MKTIKTEMRASKNTMLFPGILYLVVFFIVPLFYLLRYSFYKFNPNTLYDAVFTVENYTKFFETEYYRQVLFDSFEMAVIVSILAVILAYPVAYYLVRCQNRFTPILSSIIYLPLLASSVVVSFGWMILLSDNGVINNVLMQWGIIQTPIKIMYSKTGVVIALLQAFLPFMVVCIRNVLYTVDTFTEEAAMTLGASPWKTFFKVTLPLSMSGIASGTLLVFVGVLSSFVIPGLIGGGKINTLASIIIREAQVNINWPMASALAFILLVVASIAVYLQNRVLESRFLGGGGRK
ncbi:MAG: ABC transporter permease [Megasphaera sp.]|nr:ABC transporter permease [Megasphaera sp.]